LRRQSEQLAKKEQLTKQINWIMKKQLAILLPLPALTLALFIASCTKEGPQGPAGENGINGTDGTATCGQCHNSGESFLAKVIQWEASVHANGGNFERNSESCAPCHTSMGFREIIETGEETTSAVISDPTPINCYTCHKIHENYDASDWAIRFKDPVTYYEGGKVTDLGSSNLCAKCHQSRPVDPYPAKGEGNTVFDESVSYRWGPHHGPQSNLFSGAGVSGAYEIGSGYENSYHTANLDNACVTCHMADAYGAQAGGHTFNMSYDYHGSTEFNFAGCLTSGCHDDPDNLLVYVENKQAEIEVLMEELATLLTDQGLMREDGYLNVPGTYTNAQTGAFYNYKFLEEDRSKGIHNFKYSKKLLENSIAAIQ